MGGRHDVWTSRNEEESSWPSPPQGTMGGGQGEREAEGGAGEKLRADITSELKCHLTGPL